MLFSKYKKYTIFYVILYYSLFSSGYSQNFKNFQLLQNQLLEDSFELNDVFRLGFNNSIILNNGHPNIDNFAEIYTPAEFSEFYSTSFYYSNKRFSLRLEPYILNHHKPFSSNLSGNYSYNNNHYKPINSKKISEFGFKQSYITLKLMKIGLSYGKMSHWWGPGIHSAISLSTNAPSQVTYSIRSLDEIRVGNFSVESQLIAMPYKNVFNENIFFTGLKSSISHNTKESKITFGFHRTYLSGDFIANNAINLNNWTLLDAAKLVVEPLFGQSKRNLDYTLEGTPGFDKWDEVLTGFVKINFHEENIEVYLDIASDDNRANLIDLTSHWDHTLGYQLGINKKLTFNKGLFFLASEYTTTRTSNTFNGKFYRGNENSPNFYTKTQYDYFSYEGRRMGAHSGTSSSDLFFMISYEKLKRKFFLTLNIEKHGLKNMLYPEVKSELTFSIQSTLYNNIKISSLYEYETITNYGFIKESKSISRPIWISISYYFNNI